MKTVSLKGREIQTMADVHRLFAETLEFPEYYGHNLDALYDCLTDLNEAAAVEISGEEALRSHLGDRYDTLLRVLQDAAAEVSLTVTCLDKKEGLSNMDTLELIQTRRSTRKFRNDPVDPDKLAAVIEAGRFAPSGGNSQSTHFMVVKSRKVLDALAEMVKVEFARMEITPGMYKSKVASITASKAGNYIFHYNAPVLIITANQKDYGNNIADCACALENMMIAANALDLGSCWINQLKWLNESPFILDYLKELGLHDGERVYGALALGYADSADGLPNRKPLPRSGNEVTFIED